tara:strand:+ start:316 stop:594 length:279 start_codon:yes stop_codon:yes gene_type:complete
MTGNMRWIHTRNFDLMGKTSDDNVTPDALAAHLVGLMKGDSIFDEFLDSLEGEWLTYWAEDTEGLDNDKKIERVDEILEQLYNYADSERIAL